MNRLKTSMLVCAIATVLTSLLLTTSMTKAASASGCSWTLVSSPNSGTGDNALDGVATISQNDVWAVGYFTNGSTRQTLIEHWNGTNWSIVPSPNPTGSTFSLLSAVTAISASNIWAVGYYSNSSNVDETLTEHWNGTSWSIVSSPNVTGASANLLNGVTALSASSIWTVGEYFNSSSALYQTLIEHWNGTNWRIIPSPNVASDTNFLDGVAAASAKEVWAVGESFSLFTPAKTLIEEWNGTSWSLVPSPNPSSNASILFAVAAVSANDVWAVGDGYNSQGTSDNTLTEEWNGTSWSIVRSPNPAGATNSVFNAVAVVSATDIWAVGTAFISSSNTRETLTENWNGTSWSLVPSISPNPNSLTNDFTGVAHVRGSTSAAWSVGYYANTSNVDQTLTESHC